MLSSEETEKRLLSQLWRKKTFQCRARSCPSAGGDDTVSVTWRAVSLGNKGVTSWGGATLGEGEAGDCGGGGGRERADQSLLSGMERPCLLLALSSGFRLGRGGDSGMGQDRWP